MPDECDVPGREVNEQVFQQRIGHYERNDHEQSGASPVRVDKLADEIVERIAHAAEAKREFRAGVNQRHRPEENPQKGDQQADGEEREECRQDIAHHGG